ncbi:MAG: outer membrane protein transport protein [Gammaproteobacteria bacterium]
MAYPKSIIKTSALLITIGVAYSSISLASGFRLPEVSTVGIGTSNALVANTTEIGALPYNPAGMSFHEGKALAAGITMLNYDLTVTPDGGTKTDNAGEDSFLIPNLFFMARGNGPWSFGLSINSPFGLETKWPDETFPVFAGPLDPVEPELSRIKMVNLNPNLAYKIDNSTSVAFGINYYDVMDVVLNTQALKINGSGTGFGFNLGVQKKIGALSLGLSYRTSVDVDISGSFDATGIGSGALAARTSVEFPDLLQLGAHYQVNDKLGIELDIEQTGWSSFDKIKVTDAAGAELITSTSKWDDVTAYRLGFIYQLNNKTKLLFGYSVDEGVTDKYFSARVPGNDRDLVSAGVTHDYGDWTLEASYMRVTLDDRDYNSTTAPNTDANGTLAFNGEYESSADLFSVGASMKF